MKAQTKINDDFSIIPEYLQRKIGGNRKTLENLREVLESQRNIGNTVWNHRNRDSNGVLPNPNARALVKDNTPPPVTYKNVQARFRPPFLRWYFMYEYTVKLVAWDRANGNMLDNIVKYFFCPYEFIQRYATKIWKENYEGCEKTIYIYVEGAHNPVMVASNWIKIRVPEKQTIETQTDL